MRVKLRRKGQVTIPEQVRRALQLEKGDFLVVSVRDGAIVLEPRALIDADQAWFWRDDWKAGEREASEDIVAGRTRRFVSDQDFLGSLD